MASSVLKPGILVSLKTTLSGGVSYKRVDIETADTLAKWETTRKIDDPAEYKSAIKLRAQAAAAIRTLCAHTAFGLLCPETDEVQLDAAIAEAHKICNEWNAEASGMQVRIYVLKGRIASSDEEAAKAIASEVEGLLGEMEKGIAEVNVKAIRDAANRAKQIGAVLDDKQAAKVSVAIDAARKAAKEIVKRVEKEGEDAVRVLADLGSQRAAVEMARFAFLDIDAPRTNPAVSTEVLPSTMIRDLEV